MLYELGLSFMGIVNFSIWLNIPSIYIEDLYVTVSVIVGTLSELLTVIIFAFVFLYFSSCG